MKAKFETLATAISFSVLMLMYGLGRDSQNADFSTKNIFPDRKIASIYGKIKTHTKKKIKGKVSHSKNFDGNYVESSPLSFNWIESIDEIKSDSEDPFWKAIVKSPQIIDGVVRLNAATMSPLQLSLAKSSGVKISLDSPASLITDVHGVNTDLTAYTTVASDGSVSIDLATGLEAKNLISTNLGKGTYTLRVFGETPEGRPYIAETKFEVRP